MMLLEQSMANHNKGITRIWFVCFGSLAFLSGCVAFQAPGKSVDVIPVLTESAATIVAELTLSQRNSPAPSSASGTPDVGPTPSIEMPTASPTPSPVLTTVTSPVSTNTPLVLPCDLAQFVQDVSIPDGSRFDRSESFKKIWRVRNVGSCDWYANYSIVFSSGVAMAAKKEVGFPEAIIHPGDTVDLEVAMSAPAEDGKFRSYWGIKNPAGDWVPFVTGGSNMALYVDIVSGTGKPKNTDTPGQFRVLDVLFTVERSGACNDPNGKYVVTAKVSSSKEGTITYAWKRSDGGVTELQQLTFLSASKKELVYEWKTDQTGLWVDLFVDEPNHQQFGRAKLLCP